jgi:uncharacterized membrane protein YqaE (UPF0057 family)
MKKIVTRFLVIVVIASLITSPAIAASLPGATATPPATSVPGREEVKKAMDEFNSLSHKEKKSRLKEVKKLYKEYRAAKKAHRDDDEETNTILLAILAILLPPLAVFLKEGEANVKFWIDLVLVLLLFFSFFLWIIPVAFALLVVFDVL